MALPLADVRVLDLTIARAGPTCVRQLADWGADVVRVEPPRHGTPGENEPVRLIDSDIQNLHRNKRSLGLDLKTAEGRELVLRLAERADVLVENMRPGVKHRLGFDYETVRARNSRIVYGSISGFGQDGPYAERGGVDQIAQGMGGLMSVTGEPGRGPLRVGIPVSDLAAGLFLAVGILAALHERERTGQGRWVQTSLLEAMVGMMDLQAARWTIDGRVPEQEGNHHPTLVPMGCFASADGWVNIAGPGGRLLRRFCEAIELPELLSDPRFEGATKRSENRIALNELVAAKLRTRTTAEWVERLNAAGVPCGPVYRVDEVFADPQVRHLGLVEPVEHARLGKLGLVRNAARLAGAHEPLRRATPDPGQHSGEILGELGLSAAEIADLRARRVVG